MAKLELPDPVTFLRKKDYKPIKILERGSFGQTVILKDEVIDLNFVCKKYEPQDGIDKDVYFENFLNEIKILFLLSHRNIVRVFNYYIYRETKPPLFLWKLLKVRVSALT